MQRTITTNARGLALLQDTLQECGYQTSRSVANFVMVDCGTQEAAAAFHRRLLEAGFITRPLVAFGLPSCVRISTGTDDQNMRLAATLRELATQFTLTDSFSGKQ